MQYCLVEPRINKIHGISNQKARAQTNASFNNRTKLPLGQIVRIIVPRGCYNYFFSQKKNILLIKSKFFYLGIITQPNICAF